VRTSSRNRVLDDTPKYPSLLPYVEISLPEQASIFGNYLETIAKLLKYLSNCGF
jgi:hypothetical protein